MSQDFKLKFDDFKDNNPSEEKESEYNAYHYSTPGHVRNIAFVWPDGKMHFFNYNYLINCILDNDAGSILIEFSTHHVEIKGHNLEQTFSEIMAQVSKYIIVTNKRYNPTQKVGLPVVNDVIITVK